MEMPSDYIVDITASGLGGLDTGLEASNTWYYVWIIQDVSDGSVGAIFSVSSTSPTMPSGYTKKRLSGAIRNLSSGDFPGYQEQNNRRVYTSAQAISTGSGTAPGSWNADISAIVPPGTGFAFLTAQTYATLSGGTFQMGVTFGPGGLFVSHAQMDLSSMAASCDDATSTWAHLTDEQEITVSISGIGSWELYIAGYTHDAL
jgi:hypothetical protein